MSGVANPKLALRPYLPADTPILAAIFRASIEELTGDDYDEEQQEAWASAVDDEADFAARLGERLTLIGTLGGSPIGFIALEGTDKIDLLYVHPAAAGQGVAAMLCDAIEKLAAEGRVERHRGRFLHASRLRRPAAQHGAARRRLARQHHHGKAARGEKPRQPFVTRSAS